MRFRLEIVEGINFMVGKEIYRKSAVQLLTIHPFIYPSTNRSIYPYLFTCLSECLSIYLSIYLSV